MRNIFDQYQQPENRLTHALVSTLAEDPRLLRRFIQEFAGVSIPKVALQIVEQQRPGEPRPRSEDEASGLPDAWIYTDEVSDEGWTLLLECKIAAQVTIGQLQRHLATAERQNFKRIRLLVITARALTKRLPARTRAVRWAEVYSWLVRQARDSALAQRCSEYFAILEAELPEEYLKEGGLTTFSGITFNPASPYSYLEAKRLLQLAWEELRTNRKLARVLGMDPKSVGRGAITGRDSDSVWNFLSLKHGRGDDVFTHYPHLTLSIKSDMLLAIVTVPHGIKRDLRRRLINLGEEGFAELLRTVSERISSALHKDKGAVPWAEVLQRRYLTQRSTPIVDAKMEFDLRTAFPKTTRRRKKSVKVQPQWLEATYRALAKKQSNLQLVVGAAFPYGRSSSVGKRAILENIVETWVACRPLLSAMGIK